MRQSRFPISNLSIRRRLPLLIGTLLSGIIIASTWASYRGVKESAFEVGRERLQSLTGQLANQTQQSFATALGRTFTAANDTTVRSFLQFPSSTTRVGAVAVLKQFSPPQDQNGLQVELWSANHTPMLVVPEGSSPEAADLTNEFNQSAAEPFKVAGPIRVIKNMVAYTATAAVKDDAGKPIGYLVRWRRALPAPNARKQLADLLGSEASLYYGNTKGDVWTDLEKVVSKPPGGLQSTLEVTHYMRDGNPVMALGRPITGTPWFILVEFPERALLIQANRFLRSVLMIDVALLLIGVAGAFALSLSITGPLQSLTQAASSVSAGDYTRTVDVRHNDELGALAHAFNAMLVKVRGSQRELEQKVKDRTAQLEAAAGALLMVDANGVINSANAKAEQLFGYQAGELLRQPVETLVPERYRHAHPGLRAGFFKAPSARPMGAGRDLYGRRKDGSEVPIEIGLYPIETDGGAFLLASIIDITERKRAEERFRTAVEASPSGILMVDREGRITLANTQTERLFGFSRSELLGQPIEILLPERYRDAHPGLRLGFFEHPTTRAMGAGRDLYGRRKDGSEVPIEIGLNPIETAEGTVVLASIIDITERKRREEQSHLQGAALESAANAILITDAYGKIIWVNKAFTESTGYLPEEVIGKNPRFLKSGQQDPEFYKGMWEAILAGNVWRDTVINRRKDGTLNHEDMTITPILNGSRKITHFVAIKQDITELERTLAELQKKSEELAAMTQQLWQASKLATVGELAASVAHELNNPLATISLRLESLAAQFGGDEPKLRAVEIVSDEVERMGRLVSNLLQFSRRTHQQTSTIDVCEEIDNSLELIEYHLRSQGIDMVRDYASNLPTIQADRQQLRQVFLNLLTNASDAMSGGKIIVSVRVAQVEDGGKNVRIEFVDSGPGIPAANLEKIWDPFFTTKPEGKGTGLGLAICRRVVEEHHGSISIASRPGEGTTVSIFLPATNGKTMTKSKIDTNLVEVIDV
jgi:PAS domain S-box-containing protein